MPSGGKRKGAGRKPKPLAEKLAAGNPGRHPLKKVEFNVSDTNQSNTPEYLRTMEKKTPGIPTPTEIYEGIIRYLEPSECLNLIPEDLIGDYVLAKYYLRCAQYELSKTATVAKNEKNEYAVTGFADAVLRLQKNVITTWTPIWDIVSRNSVRTISNPEQDMLAIIFGGRQRKKRPKGGVDDGHYEHTENSGEEPEPGDV